MRPQVLALLALATLTLGLLAALIALSLSSRRREPPSLREGRLQPCPSSPNCVSSQAAEPEHRIPPIALSGEPERAWRQLCELVESMPRARVVERRADYLRAEVESPLLRFVDDLELSLDPCAGLVHLRSASRVGHSDLGANRRRVEALRRAFERLGRP